MTSYSSGDAKWYANPVTIEPGQSYVYRHHYKANVSTEVVVQFIDAQGNSTYAYLGAALPSANWTPIEYSFTAPASARRVTVLHVLAGVGQLSIDDAFLGRYDPPSGPGGSVVPNPSLEVSNGGLPRQWQRESWGSNSATFDYLNEGHSGSRSVRVNVNNYVSGDAKWVFSPVSLTPGEQFRFGVWYRTNTTPNAVAMFTRANGQVFYQGMPNPQPSGNPNEWQHYSDTFSVPTDAVSASVFLFLTSNGWLQTDDYEITPYDSVGFDRPLVTLTFDDGHEDNITSVLPVLESYGFDSTQCYATTFIEDAPNPQAVINDVLAFQSAGHEICSHTVTHPFLSQIPAAQAEFELTHSKQYLESITGRPITSFASPFGDYNAAVNQQIAGLYRTHRTVNEGYNSKDNFDIYQLRVQNMLSTTTLAEFQSWLDSARETNTWLILVYHRVASDAGEFDTFPADFAQQLAALQSSGLTVKTLGAALDEVVPQL